MNKQRKDGNISWTDYTWNPIKGLCPVGCWYCYGRAMYKRFKWDPKIRLALDDPYHISILQNSNLKPGTKVFICSMFEMFHPLVKKEWRDLIFKIIKMNPKLIFQILTKMPENIDRPMPDNVWLGISVAGEDRGADIVRMWGLGRAKAKIKFISLEPLLKEIDPYMLYRFFDWYIIGRLTGHGHKHDPPKEWLAELIRKTRLRGIPIFLKNNLKEIWGEKLIQEFPE